MVDSNDLENEPTKAAVEHPHLEPSRKLPKIGRHTPDNREIDGLSRKGSMATVGTRAEGSWAEMQNTLEEVELSASGGTSAFSAEHGKALEELRKAQIALAQAWARGEAEDDGADEILGEDAEEKSRAALGAGKVLGDGQAHVGSKRSARDKSENPANTQLPSLNEETVNDILLARKRREANDRYFEKVNKNVIDVIQKLDVVAKKMRGVELEAQDLWDSQSSLGSSSRA